jgi:catechol 2,3-dioxygenase-like lactoylglutathione lyase family enzyme
MGLHRLTSITLGVPDVEASASFFGDFGLDGPAGSTGEPVRLATRDGGEQLELAETPVRQLIRLGVGAEHGDDLARIAARAEASPLAEVIESTPELLALSELATGLRVEVSVAEPYTAPTSDHPYNRPGASPERVDVPAPSVLTGDPVRPSNLTHVVYGTPDQPATLAFFTDVVGFEISDQVPGVIAFTRCGAVHHNLAIQAAPVAFPHHIAFEVDDVDDVVRGGQAMVDADPDRHMWGVGRHAIGSNWFWYLREPGGTYVEYTSDIDRISAQDLYRPKDWQGHEFLYSFGPPTPQEFLEPRDLADLIAAST